MGEAERRLEQLAVRVRQLPHKVAARETYDFFRTLPMESARALAETRPRLVAGLDGAPPQLRYLASHLILVEAQQQLLALVENGAATDAQRTRLATVDEMLRPVSKGLQIAPDGGRVEVVEPRQFLYAEVEGQGRMIEVLGDLETAHNVVVLIPGMNNDLDKVRAQMDRAQSLKQAVGPRNAVVVWKDYDAPLGLEEAMSTQSSRAAVPRLSRFEAGLDAVKAQYAKTTFIGNSYGSQVLGRGLMAGVDPRNPDGVTPDRAVLVGCPGIDESVTSAAQITPPGTQLFVARAKGDYVSYLEKHGPDPADFPDVFRFETESGPIHVRGHMSYFELNSESFKNIARIGRGQLSAVTPAARTTPQQESRVLIPGVSWSEPLRKVGHSEAAVPLAKVFDGITALQKISSPAAKKPLDGSRNRRDGGSPARKPEGPAR
jgi:hypothetical protein